MSSSAKVPDDYIEAAEVAARLKISPSWVKKAACRRSNPLPSHKVGKNRRYVWAEVDAFIRSSGDGR